MIKTVLEAETFNSTDPAFWEDLQKNLHKELHAYRDELGSGTEQPAQRKDEAKEAQLSSQETLSSSEIEHPFPGEPLILDTVASRSMEHGLYEELDRLFAAALEEEFEDGMESRFSRALLLKVRKDGDAAVRIITELIGASAVNEGVASEAVRWLGRLADQHTHNSRLNLLINCLSHPSAQLKDAAALGLASLEDPSAIPDLKKAVEREQCSELREDIAEVLRDLEDS